MTAVGRDVAPAAATGAAPAGVTQAQVLAMVENGRAELDRAWATGDPAEVARVADRAEAIRYLSKKAGLALSASNAAARLKVDAERRAGALLRETEKHPAGRPAAEIPTTRVGNSPPPKLSEIGISYNQSSRWQDMARVPEEHVRAFLDAQEATKAEITSAAIQHMGARIRRAGKITDRHGTYEATPPDERPASVIYADPPWRYDFAVSDSRRIENQYPTMSIEEIAKVDPAPDTDAVLFLWVTSPKLPEGLAVLEAWGFTYKTSMVWVKPQIGMGYYARSQHELLLIGSIGSLPAPEPAVRPSSVIDGRRTEHSAKPDLRPVLDAMYPGVWKREMFSRRPPGGLWLVHGNETERAR